jgi:hypothetical protein
VSVPVAVDALTVIFPVFLYDGKTNSTVSVSSSNGAATVSVAFGNGKQVFAVPKGVVSVGYDQTKQYNTSHCAFVKTHTPMHLQNSWPLHKMVGNNPPF